MPHAAYIKKMAALVENGVRRNVCVTGAVEPPAYAQNDEARNAEKGREHEKIEIRLRTASRRI